MYVYIRASERANDNARRFRPTYAYKYERESAHSCNCPWQLVLYIYRRGQFCADDIIMRGYVNVGLPTDNKKKNKIKKVENVTARLSFEVAINIRAIVM